MGLFFTSDEHVDHRNIIKFCDRPFRDLSHMRDELTRRHNAVVGEDDEVWHLGDMFWRTFGTDNAIEYMKQLNGTHFYVFGNHEELMEQSEELRKCFAGIYVRHQIYPNGAPKHGIVLDHYAGRVWHDSDKGAWQLYGHTHAVLPEIDPLLAFDVGVDANNYTPLSLEEVQKRMWDKMSRITRNLGLSAKR